MVSDKLYHGISIGTFYRLWSEDDGYGYYQTDYFYPHFYRSDRFFSLQPYAGYSFFGLLYIYILARYMRLKQINISYRIIGIGYLTSLLILWGACYWATGLSGENARLAFIFLGYSNPLIIIMAVAIFFFVKGFKPFYSKWINIVFANTLIIYLLTEGVGWSLYQFEAVLIKNNLIIGILFVLATMIACLIIGKILSFFLSFLPIYQKENVPLQKN